MKIILFAAIAMVRGNFIGMKIISLAAIAMVRGQNNVISFFDERERERGGGRRDCPTFVENICINTR